MFAAAASESPARAQTPTIEGYPWPTSVRQGEQLGLYVSSSTGAFDVEVFREGATSLLYFSAQGLPTTLQSSPSDAYSSGCNWKRSLLLTIPTNWPSGVYTVVLRAGGATRRTVFVVKENEPGSTGEILLVLSTATWQAYNNWGGKSLYDGGSTDSVRANTVSFRRPYALNNGLGSLPVWELPFIRWIENEGYAIEYAVNADLHDDPDLEAPYALLLSVGHDEYWSKEMRAQVEARIQAGRSVAFFSGNTCWYQVRFTPSLDRMTCYKSAAADPMFGVDNSRVTVTWSSFPVSRPENIMTGVSSRKGGYVNSHGYYPAADGYGDYTVIAPDQWVFAGTGLTGGAEFGYAATIVGYETDGAAFQWVDGEARVTGEDMTPLNFRILAWSPASHGAATMGLFYGPGAVFNAATTDWAHGLAADPIVQQITRNVIDSLLVMQVQPIAVGDDLPALPFRVLAAPNPFATLTRIAFELPAEERVRLAVFDVRGLRVATLLDGILGAGSHVLPWTGVDERGREVRAGVYLYRLEAGPVVRTGKAIKIR